MQPENMKGGTSIETQFLLTKTLRIRNILGSRKPWVKRAGFVWDIKIVLPRKTQNPHAMSVFIPAWCVLEHRPKYLNFHKLVMKIQVRYLNWSEIFMSTNLPDKRARCLNISLSGPASPSNGTYRWRRRCRPCRRNTPTRTPACLQAHKNILPVKILQEQVANKVQFLPEHWKRILCQFIFKDCLFALKLGMADCWLANGSRTFKGRLLWQKLQNKLVETLILDPSLP